MSETQQPMTDEQQYAHLSMLAGDLQYKIFSHGKELEKLNEQIMELNMKAYVKKQALAEAKAEEAKKEPHEQKHAQGPRC